MRLALSGIKEEMIETIITGIVIVAVFIVTVVLLQKIETEKPKQFWVGSVLFAIAISIPLAGLAIFNLFFYAFVALIILMFTRVATAQMFINKHGSAILGLYLGFWLSLPAGVYSYGT